MATEGHAAAAASPPGDVAAAIRDAGFARFVATASGDALAAAGLLARACSAADVPFHVGVDRTERALADRLERGEGAAIAVGASPTAADGAVRSVAAADGPTTVVAVDVARALGGDLDGTGRVLALAGVVAGGGHPADDAPGLLESATEAGTVERRPGVAVPGGGVADGLAHSTLLCGPFSADPAAARALLDAVDGGDDGRPVDGDDGGRTVDGGDGDRTVDGGDDDRSVSGDDDRTDDARRALASAVAVEVAGDEAASGRAATALEAGLRPHATPDGPLASVEGLADVLDALAAAAPGAGVALALGGDGREAALAAWREHARAAHEGLRAATTGRYDGMVVARVRDAPVATTARLLADFRSPEPVGVAVADGEAAAVARSGASAPEAAMRTAATALDDGAAADGGSDLRDADRPAGDGAGSPAGVGPVARGVYATFDGAADDFVVALREAL